MLSPPRAWVVCVSASPQLFRWEERGSQNQQSGSWRLTPREWCSERPEVQSTGKDQVDSVIHAHSNQYHSGKDRILGRTGRGIHRFLFYLQRCLPQRVVLVPAFFTEYQCCSRANQALANVSKIMDFLAILAKNFKTQAETTKGAE